MGEFSTDQSALKKLIFSSKSKASEYDEKYKKWRYEDLPIVPECWKYKILEVQRNSLES